MRTWILLLIGAVSASAAGPVTFGVKAGLPLTDFFSAVKSQNFSFSSNSKHLILGPSVELRLPAGFSVELDALYRRMSYGGAVSSLSLTQSVRGNGFEFPLLLKYKLPGVKLRPYVDAGFAFDSLSGLTHTVASKTGLSNSDPSGHGTKGFVMGAGLDLNAHILHITPEIRYTRWGSSRITDPLTLVQGNQNQAEFLLGITF